MNRKRRRMSEDAAYDPNWFISKWPEAVVHAENVRRHHDGAQTPKPANPSTEVDRLARALNDSAPAHRRKLPPPKP